MEKTKSTFEIKKQHLVDCTYAKYAFDELTDADEFAEKAVERDFHDEKDKYPIARRVGYVLWKDGEFLEELEGVQHIEQARERAQQYMEAHRVKIF